MIYKTKVFQAKFRKSSLQDSDLATACDEMSRGLIDADLGDHLYKKRIAMPGKGKSGSYRTMVGAVVGDKYFFLYIFAKSNKSNITKKETLALKELASEFVNIDEQKIKTLVKNGELLIVR